MLCCNPVLPEQDIDFSPDAEVSKVNPGSGCSVREVVGKLKEKHGSKFTVEKINALSLLICLILRKTLPALDQHKLLLSPEPCAPSSPRKHIRYRSESWTSLVSGIACLQEQYKELQGTILSDIANL